MPPHRIDKGRNEEEALLVQIRELEAELDPALEKLDRVRDARRRAERQLRRRLVTGDQGESDADEQVRAELEKALEEAGEFAEGPAIRGGAAALQAPRADGDVAAAPPEPVQQQEPQPDVSRLLQVGLPLAVAQAFAGLVTTADLPDPATIQEVVSLTANGAAAVARDFSRASSRVTNRPAFLRALAKIRVRRDQEVAAVLAHGTVAGSPGQTQEQARIRELEICVSSSQS